jgi:hypothetical protein
MQAPRSAIGMFAQIKSIEIAETSKRFFFVHYEPPAPVVAQFDATAVAAAIKAWGFYG